RLYRTIETAFGSRHRGGSRLSAHGFRLWAEDTRRLLQVRKGLPPRRPRAKSQEPRAKSQEPRAKSRDPRAKSRKPKAESRHASAVVSPGQLDWRKRPLDDA